MYVIYADTIEETMQQIIGDLDHRIGQLRTEFAALKSKNKKMEVDRAVYELVALKNMYQKSLQVVGKEPNKVHWAGQ